MSHGKLDWTKLHALLREDGYLTNGQASELSEKLLPYINPTPAALTDGQILDLVRRVTAKYTRRDNDLLYLEVVHAALREAVAPAEPQSDRTVSQIMEALKNADNECTLSFSAKEMRAVLNVWNSAKQLAEGWRELVAPSASAQQAPVAWLFDSEEDGKYWYDTPQPMGRPVYAAPAPVGCDLTPRERAKQGAADASDMGQDSIAPDCPHDTCDPTACRCASPAALTERFERIKRLALDAGGQGALPVPQSLRKIVRECLDGVALLAASHASPAPAALTDAQYVEAARKADQLGEVCYFSEYDPDIGRVPEHFKPRYMPFAQALLALAAAPADQEKA